MVEEDFVVVDETVMAMAVVEIASPVENEDILPINVNLARMRMMSKMKMNLNLRPRKQTR